MSIDKGSPHSIILLLSSAGAGARLLAPARGQAGPLYILVTQLTWQRLINLLNIENKKSTLTTLETKIGGKDAPSSPRNFDLKKSGGR